MSLVFEKIKIIGANLGAENCLPDIKNNAYIQAKIAVSERVSAQDGTWIGKGMIDTILPYQMQDGYDRTRKERSFDAAILENEYLKATFIPELGGRLWSLYDKKADRELLYVNPIFQPCNLGLRNAWFSGGVEWNIGIKGHTPLTCAPLFAKEVLCTDGNSMLCMYEFERIREVCYSITAKLDQDMLLIHVKIENLEAKDKYMYWWSNIAVEEKKMTRILVPARKAYYCSYKENGYFLDRTEVPMFQGTDVSYPQNLETSRDFFYDIPKGEDKWIASVDENGYGLIQMSDQKLLGRKLFVWGEGQGGRHWSEWLSDSKEKYVEIQAGLLKTQLEHFIMEQNSEISWTEGYSGLQVQKDKAHAADIDVAAEAVKEAVKDRQSRIRHACFTVRDEKPVSYLGSGWGYVEELIRGTALSSVGSFPAESVKEEQTDWIHLWKYGRLPKQNVDQTIKSYVKGDLWLQKLLEAEDGWYKYYHLGVVLCEKGEYEKACKMFERSAAMEENAWSYRNLAQIHKNIHGDMEKACGFMRKAVDLKKDYLPLWVDCAQTLVAAGAFEEWIQVFESLPCSMKASGRLKVYYIQSLNGVGRAKEAYQLITDGFVMWDVREGEYSVSRLFIEICSKLMDPKGEMELSDEEVLLRYPLPYELDYRM